MKSDFRHLVRRGMAALFILFLAAPAATGQVKQVLQETLIRVDGMICSSCGAAVEKALRGLPGVALAQADVRADSVRVRYDGRKVTPRQLAEAIRKAGYRARPPGEKSPP